MSKINWIDGKAIAAEVRANIKSDIATLDYRPCIAVVLVGRNPGSQIYVKNKKRVAAKLGMNAIVHYMDEGTSEDRLLSVIHTLNNDTSVHGILVQLPLPDHINTPHIIHAVSPEKDIDGLHPMNAGKLQSSIKGFVPCTPRGSLHLIKSVRNDLSGLDALVIGRSVLVGRPMAQLLTNENCTVTLAHSRTKDLAQLIKSADIIVAAAGKPELFKAKDAKDGAILIDVGINRLEDGSLAGDIDTSDLPADKTLHITPVPGGVGPMTIAMLMQNTLDAAKLQHESA